MHKYFNPRKPPVVKIWKVNNMEGQYIDSEGIKRQQDGGRENGEGWKGEFGTKVSQHKCALGLQAFMYETAGVSFEQVQNKKHTYTHQVLSPFVLLSLTHKDTSSCLPHSPETDTGRKLLNSFLHFFPLSFLVCVAVFLP